MPGKTMFLAAGLFGLTFLALTGCGGGGSHGSSDISAGATGRLQDV